MKRYRHYFGPNGYELDEIDSPRIDAFLKELVDVCKKHKLSLSHEDGHGNFLVTDYDEMYSEWLGGASIEGKIE